MDFDVDDPLADLLSEGSNDSFFDEPKPAAKRGSLTKTPEKKSISDLFGLNDDKKIEQKTTTSGSGEDWLGINRKSPQTVQQSQNFQQPQTVQQPQRTVKKISFEDDDDLLNTLGLDKKSDSKPPTVEKASNEILPPAKLDPSKKSALLESILGAPKKAEERPEIKPKPRQDPIKTPTPTTTSEPSYGFSSLDAPREGRRRPTSSIKDPLGLFSTDETDKKTEPSKSIQASPVKRRDSVKTPDWLNQSGDNEARSEATARFEERAHTEGTVRHEAPMRAEGTVRTEVLFSAKGDLKTKSAPNLTELPDWLSGEPIKSHKSDSGLNHIVDQNPEIKTITNEPETTTLQSLLTQQKLATSHVEYQNTALALQQQESQILMTLQLRKYEDNLMEMQRKQQEVLVKQEQQFNNLLERQFAKQQIMENNMRLQQERINNHIQMLLSQPPVTPIPSSQSEELIRTEDLKRANSEETVKLYENIIESLKQRHHEELSLVEESYRYF